MQGIGDFRQMVNNEDLYPGYSLYVNFRGTLGILYEQFEWLKME